MKRLQKQADNEQEQTELLKNIVTKMKEYCEKRPDGFCEDCPLNIQENSECFYTKLSSLIKE